VTRECKVMVRRGDQFLVLLRCAADGGYWHTVAGGVEDGESYAEAAARELEEEVGLRAQPHDLDRTYFYDDVEVHAFLVDVEHNWEPTLNAEHDDYRWLAPADAATLLRWPETRDLALELSLGP
jgi:8-oxo-dGTP pyrophosphatase MutT (NUDIX family)